MKEKTDTTAKKKRAHAHPKNAGTHNRKSAHPLTSPQIIEFIERISDGFVAFDAQMNYIYVNQRGGDLLGRKPEDLVGKNYWVEYPDARGTPFANAYVRALETQTPIMLEDYYEPWDRWFENRIYPSSHGLSILFSEITERKKAEEAGREQNRFITTLAETIPGLVYIYDWQTGSNVYSNGGIEYLLGYSAEDVKNMGKELFARLIHPDDGAEVVASQLRLASANDKDTLEVDYRFRHSNGDWRWLRSYERPFARNDDGSLKQKIGIAIDITERKQADERIQHQLKHLNALRMIDIAISSNFDLKVVLNIVLQYVLSQLSVDASAVLLLKPHLQTMEYVASRGFQTPAMQRPPLRLSDGYANRVVAERRTIHIPDITRTETRTAQSPQMAGEGFVDYYGTPLIVKGEVKGVLEIYHRAPLDFDSDKLEFFETIAGQSAIAIDNAQLFAGMQQANTELIMAYDATITGWSRAMALRDKDSEGHAQRVTDMTLVMARAMGISESQMVHMRRGALLHDIGKIGVPENILVEPSSLTAEEQEIMRKHPDFSYTLLSPIAYLQPALDIPYCHHEKWDGTGYPRGLKGKEIPIAARIFSVADVWDVITSDQPYRKAMPRADALKLIKSESGKSFDPQVVTVFLELISDPDDPGPDDK